jgi:transposase-like protein
VYVVEGHPEIVRKLGRKGRRRRLKGARGRGTLDKEKPPIFGLFQRKGEVAIQMLPNVQQATIQPVVTGTVTPGSRLYTDEYDIYRRLTDWGYEHKTVNHSQGEYARDDDGDGFQEVPINTLEGFWSWLRSWLRPHRGISQKKLPLSLGILRVRA